MNLARLAAFALVLHASACVAVYPELDTRLSKAVAGQPMVPGPPDDVRWLKFESATVPDRTRDGRTWASAFGKNPDPYARLYVNEVEVLKTPIQGNTLTPTWPNAPHGNYHVKVDDKLRVELWDQNAMGDAPIGVRELGRLTPEQIADKRIEVDLEGGARIVLALEPAHAMIGLGLWYELKNGAAVVTRMYEKSPAERSGLKAGDEVLTINGRAVSAMSPDEVRSNFNAVPFDGLKLDVKHLDGTRRSVVLKEGPIYPTFKQFGPID